MTDYPKRLTQQISEILSTLRDELERSHGNEYADKWYSNIKGVCSHDDQVTCITYADKGQVFEHPLIDEINSRLVSEVHVDSIEEDGDYVTVTISRPATKQQIQLDSFAEAVALHLRNECATPITSTKLIKAIKEGDRYNKFPSKAVCAEYLKTGLPNERYPSILKGMRHSDNAVVWVWSSSGQTVLKHPAEKLVYSWHPMFGPGGRFNLSDPTTIH